MRDNNQDIVEGRDIQTLSWHDLTQDQKDFWVKASIHFEYQNGLTSGFIDGCIIDEPVNTGQHTYEFYSCVSVDYLRSIDPFVPHSAYEYGYGCGFDLAAIYTSASRGERWQDRTSEVDH